MQAVWSLDACTMRPRMEEGGSRSQPPSVFMLTLSLIGIGCGDPEQLTLAAIRAINAADLVLIPRKGADKSDLAELRRTICAQALSGNRPRLVEFELPQRDDKDFYRADLVGCEVVNLEGLDLGIVQHFIETPAQVLMVVRGAQEFWIPAVPQHLRRVDLPQRRVVVDWSAAGSGT